MSIFSSSIIGKLVHVNEGLLNDKVAMIVKEYEEGYGVVPQKIDWPAAVPAEFNALYVPKNKVTDLTDEEETIWKLKFPDPKQFE